MWHVPDFSNAKLLSAVTLHWSVGWICCCCPFKIYLAHFLAGRCSHRESCHDPGWVCQQNSIKSLKWKCFFHKHNTTFNLSVFSDRPTGWNSPAHSNMPLHDIGTKLEGPVSHHQIQRLCMNKKSPTSFGEVDYERRKHTSEPCFKTSDTYKHIHWHTLVLIHPTDNRQFPAWTRGEHLLAKHSLKVHSAIFSVRLCLCTKPEECWTFISGWATD